MDEKAQKSGPLTPEIRVKGRFVKGARPGPGRPRGAKNVLGASIKELMISAAERLGDNGKGGVGGFIERIGRENPELLAAALIRSSVPAAAPEPAPETDFGPITFVVMPVVRGGCCVLDEN